MAARRLHRLAAPLAGVARQARPNIRDVIP